ncbi:MAG TPA: hypothetical protein VGO47_12270 [Chlamydiales bacterium]|jgi:hypothetical protein|nr:hypothetical protein [Chlamydiales bacterium]
MQKVNLINLSTELVDAIVNYIDDPKDVLNSALACRRLYQVIVPCHLEFRHIRSDSRQKDLWDELIQRPILAARVRFLEIRWTHDGWMKSPSKSILPRSMGLAPIDSVVVPDTMDFTPLTAAVECMDSLIRFSWIGHMPHGIGHLFMAIDNRLSPLKELQLSYEDGIVEPAIFKVCLRVEALLASNSI